LLDERFPDSLRIVDPAAPFVQRSEEATAVLVVRERREQVSEGLLGACVIALVEFDTSPVINQPLAIRKSMKCIPEVCLRQAHSTVLQQCRDAMRKDDVIITVITRQVRSKVRHEIAGCWQRMRASPARPMYIVVR
jgi:hypothetical protein